MRTPRNAAALMGALVVLTVTSIVAVQLVRLVVLQEKTAREAVARRQSQILAESALDRALITLADSPDYSGETWIASAELRREMQAEIKVFDDQIEIVARVGTGNQAAAYRLEHTVGEEP